MVMICLFTKLLKILASYCIFLHSKPTDFLRQNNDSKNVSSWPPGHMRRAMVTYLYMARHHNKELSDLYGSLCHWERLSYTGKIETLRHWMTRQV